MGLDSFIHLTITQIIQDIFVIQQVPCSSQSPPPIVLPVLEFHVHESHSVFSFVSDSFYPA